MAQTGWLRRMIVVFHLALGIVILYGAATTALRGGTGTLHIRLLASVEALGAVLFLVPRTLGTGALLLLLTIVLALAFHLSLGEWRGDLLVYAAGVGLIAAHGPTYGRGR